MAKTMTLLAVFQDVDPAADAIEQLRSMDIADDQMTVISGVPVSERILGRPSTWTNVPRLALGGSVAGFLIGAFFAFGTPAMYPLSVGDQGLYAIPPSIIVLFEMTMLGLLISTFLGVFLDSYFPSYTPKEYVPEISDGKIGILFSCPAEMESRISQAMTALGAEAVKPAEAQQL